MKSIAIKLSVALLMLMGASMNAQDFQGKAYYESKTSVDMDGFGGRQMSEEQKKQVANRMKSLFEKTYVLTFNQTESMYKEDEKLEAPGASSGGRFGGFASSFTGGPQYKNVKEGQLLQEQEFFGKQFLVKDELKPLQWVMGTETKQIGQYTAFKATAVKQVTGTDFSSFRGRGAGDDSNKKDKDSISGDKKKGDTPREITVTAWYTPQIPINQGPGEYWGLPGLILEINADKTIILCSKIILNPGEKDEIKVPSKGKEVTREAYDKIVKDKTAEMRENFSGRGGRGGRR
ncbi:GLPGLI family protein [Lacinutrix undariae]